MIRFRGISLDDMSNDTDVDFDGTFIYGNYEKAGDDVLISSGEFNAEGGCMASVFVQVDPKTVGQFTGLKDVNGNDIYEGDIVQPVSSYVRLKRGKPFEVKKGNYVYGKWIAKDISNKGFSVNGCYFDYEIQVTGNVNENPELMEADK